MKLLPLNFLTFEKRTPQRKHYKIYYKHVNTNIPFLMKDMDQFLRITHHHKQENREQETSFSRHIPSNKPNRKTFNQPKEGKQRHKISPIP